MHVSEVDDGEPEEGAQNPLDRYPVGAALRAVVLEQPSSRAVRCMVRFLIHREPCMYVLFTMRAGTSTPTGAEFSQAFSQLHLVGLCNSRCKP